jgi:hypothetical protein
VESLRNILKIRNRLKFNHSQDSKAEHSKQNSTDCKCIDLLRGSFEDYLLTENYRACRSSEIFEVMFTIMFGNLLTYLLHGAESFLRN